MFFKMIGQCKKSKLCSTGSTLRERPCCNYIYIDWSGRIINIIIVVIYVCVYIYMHTCTYVPSVDWNWRFYHTRLPVYRLGSSVKVVTYHRKSIQVEQELKTRAIKHTGSLRRSLWLHSVSDLIWKISLSLSLLFSCARKFYCSWTESCRCWLFIVVFIISYSRDRPKWEIT